jgi:hypothetical protein
VPEYASLNSFGQALADAAIAKTGKTVLGELHRAVQSKLTTLLNQGSPVGSGRDPHPGLLKKSWISEPNPESIQAGTESTVYNFAPHVQVIDRGRLLGKVSRKRPGTRMLGSLQAPAGISRPAFKNLAKAKDALLSEAIAKADKD